MYKPIQWVDHVVDSDGAVIQQGTLLNAENLNSMDKSIFESIILNGMLAIRDRIARDNENESQIVSISQTVTGANTATSVTIPTEKTRNKTSYKVSAEVSSATGGTVGDVLITTKQANGFKVTYTGTASSVAFKLYVQGGMI